MIKVTTITTKNKLDSLSQIGLNPEEISMVEKTFPKNKALNGAYFVKLNIEKVINNGYLERTLEVIYISNEKNSTPISLLSNSIKEAVKNAYGKHDPLEDAQTYIDFLETNKRYPKYFMDKKKDELNESEYKERKLAYKLQNLKRNSKFAEQLKPLLKKIENLRIEIKSNENAEKILKVTQIINKIIIFIETNKRLPLMFNGKKNLNEQQEIERQLCIRYFMYRDRKGEPKELIIKMNTLWKEYNGNNESDGFTPTESVEFVIDFMKENKRKPRHFPLQSDRLSKSEIIEGRAHQKFVTYKNHPDVSNDLLKRMNNLWEKNSKTDKEWVKLSFDEKAEIIIKFILKNKRLPQIFAHIKTKFLTKSQSLERRMNQFYYIERNKYNVSKDVLEKLNNVGKEYTRTSKHDKK